MKLSKAQIRLLTIMRDEDTTVGTIKRGIEYGTFILKRGYEGNRNPDIRTIFKLNKLGLIENITDPAWRWRGSEYRITQAGLDAINGK